MMLDHDPEKRPTSSKLLSYLPPKIEEEVLKEGKVKGWRGVGAKGEGMKWREVEEGKVES